MNVRRLIPISRLSRVPVLLAGLVFVASMAWAGELQSLDTWISRNVDTGSKIVAQRDGGGSSTRQIQIAPDYVSPVRRPQGIDIGQRGFDVDIWTDESRYSIGDPIKIYFRASRDAYVYIFNTDARGETRRVFPNYYDRDNRVRGGRTYSIPDRGYQMWISGPGGRESIEIVAVTEHGSWLNVFERHSKNDPYPLARSNELRQAISRRNSEVAAEAKRGTKQPESKSKSTVKKGPGAATQGVVITPPGHQPILEARAETRFRVDSRPGHGHHEEEGRLDIRVSPSQASIYVEGRYVGRGDMRLELPAGRYEIEADYRGYLSESQTVRVREDRTETVRFTLRRDRW